MHIYNLFIHFGYNFYSKIKLFSYHGSIVTYIGDKIKMFIYYLFSKIMVPIATFICKSTLLYTVYFLDADQRILLPYLTLR